MGKPDTVPIPLASADFTIALFPLQPRHDLRTLISRVSPSTPSLSKMVHKVFAI